MSVLYINGRIIYGTGLRRQTEHLNPDKYTYQQKINIAKELKPITREEALEDYDKLTHIDLSKVPPASRVGNNVVDYFTYPERLNTKGKTGISYFEILSNKSFYEKKPYVKRLISYIKKRNPTATDYRIWERVFSVYFSSINIFKPLNAMEVYDKYNPKSILDFTMGWGGRLIGACALNIPKYTGVDLNSNLKKPYADMVRMIQPLTETKIKLFFMDALKVDYSKIDYDMVFTSPPYYNKEIYKGTEALSKDEWDKEFYFPIFEKTYKHLKRGGHYILNVPVEVYERVCIKLFGKANELISFNKIKRQQGGGEKYNEYMYVWVKG